jgi:surface polysaccharide O-acyltransferase-like enzyme
MQKLDRHVAPDLIRTVAIIAVVIIHVFTDYVNTPKFFLNSTWWFANIVDSAARIAVPLFVMLSGALLLSSSKSYSTKTFLRKRFSKIGLPLLIWPLLYYAWKLYSNNKAFAFHTFIYDYISMTTYYHLYFLYLIAGLYLLTPIIKLFLQGARPIDKKYALILSSTFALGTVFIKHFLHIGFNFGTIFTISLLYIPYYLAGEYIKDITINKKIAKIMLAVLILLVAVTTFGNTWYMQTVGWTTTTRLEQASFNRYFYDYASINVAAMAVTAFLLMQYYGSLIQNSNKASFKRTLHSISYSSFGIFLIHPFILGISNKYWHWGVNSFAEPAWIYLIGKTIVIFLASYLVTILAIRTPYLKQLFS